MKILQLMFWQNKFAATVARDKRTGQELKSLEGKVIVLWEYEISDRDVLELLLSFIKNVNYE